MTVRTDLLSSHVLVVDDEPLIRNEIVWRFGREGFSSIQEACSGQEALALHESRKAELVITDIRMANGNGIELMESLRRTSEGPLPVILAMTAYPDLSLDEAYGRHVDAFFPKPFRLDDLVSASLHFLGLRKELARGNRAMQALAFVDEMGQMLTVNNMRLQRLSMSWSAGDADPAEGAATIEHVMSQNRQMLRFLADLRMRLQPARTVGADRVGVVEVLQNELDLWKSHHASQGIAIRMLVRAGLPSVFCDETLLAHAFLAMLDDTVNGAKACSNPEVTIAVEEINDNIIITCEGPRLLPSPTGTRGGNSPTDLTDVLVQRIAQLFDGSFSRQNACGRETLMLLIPVASRIRP